MVITRVTPSEVDTLLDLSRRTFYESFHDLNAPHNMQSYMDAAFTREKLLSEIANPNSEFYFAIRDGEPIGYLKINKGDAQSDIGDPESLEIERIYVDQPFQSNGIGARLLEKASERGSALGLRYMWLGVWEKNPLAVRFYERNGFRIFSSHPFHMGDEVQTDMLMKKDL
jgi:ribosomal protein S18 acetylase RimI-like enzyme